MLWEAGPPGPGALEMEKKTGVVYYRCPEDDDYRHRLDLFIPKGQKNFPVVVLIHGGVWMTGNNCCFGLYTSVGEFLASQGIAAVLPNYRLSPEIKHPEHIKDVARAVAWTRAHIAEYGGNPEKLFLAGHSAGGHLAALLGTDDTYLQDEGIAPADIRGVIAISGVYRIPPGKLDVQIGGGAPNSFRLDELNPIRGPSGWSWLGWLPGIPLSLNVFGPAFGDDPQVRAAASPINHVRPGLPPFLIISAEKDLPTLPPRRPSQPQFNHVPRRRSRRPRSPGDGGIRSPAQRPTVIEANAASSSLGLRSIILALYATPALAIGSENAYAQQRHRSGLFITRAAIRWNRIARSRW
jgi:acetyl esterase/lipase